MAERTTESEIAFMHPFTLNALMGPQPAGTYRLVVDEELIEGLSFTAYKRVGTHLEIPAISIATGKRQFLQVTQSEIDHALELDSRT
ncbi:UNVERIFIED_ORG: hypothetical protein J2W19_003162 [Shinella zoogloeoides]|nr:hypothetical protein [Shinella zoogloeoides]